jgi:hypothetical protein
LIGQGVHALVCTNNCLRIADGVGGRDRSDESLLFRVHPLTGTESFVGKRKTYQAIPRLPLRRRVE